MPISWKGFRSFVYRGHLNIASNCFANGIIVSWNSVILFVVFKSFFSAVSLSFQRPTNGNEFQDAPQGYGCDVNQALLPTRQLGYEIIHVEKVMEEELIMEDDKRKLGDFNFQTNPNDILVMQTIASLVPELAVLRWNQTEDPCVAWFASWSGYICSGPDLQNQYYVSHINLNCQSFYPAISLNGN